MLFRFATALTLFLLAVFPAISFAQILTNIRFDPAPPATLRPGQEVEVTFDYEGIDVPGVRVFVRPRTDGRPSPGYAASGSPLYPAVNGEGSGTFTVRGEDRVVVDAIRLAVFDRSAQVQLFAVDLPAKFTFAPANITLLGTSRPGSMRMQPRPATTGASSSSDLHMARIRPRPILRPHLTLRPDLKHRLIPIAPNPPDMNATQSWMFYSSVPAVRPPELPPEANATLSDQFETWMTDLNEVLLNEIRLVVDDPEAVSAFLGVEEEQGSNLFVQSSMRLYYLKLTQFQRMGGPQ